MTTSDCIFCRADDFDILCSNDLAFAIRDKFPVRSLHTLIIPRRHCETIFETTAAEREAMHELAVVCRRTILEGDPSVGGFNFGSNVGKAAGQKIFHAHVHLIPRRANEAELAGAKPD